MEGFSLLAGGDPEIAWPMPDVTLLMAVLRMTNGPGDDESAVELAWTGEVAHEARFAASDRMSPHDLSWLDLTDRSLFLCGGWKDPEGEGR